MAQKFVMAQTSLLESSENDVIEGQHDGFELVVSKKKKVVIDCEDGDGRPTEIFENLLNLRNTIIGF